MKKTLIGLLAVLALAACTSTVEIQKFPDITFAHAPKIGLNVAAIEVVRQYAEPVDAPQAPAAVLERWAHDRLVAKGTEGVARVVITDGAVTSTHLKVDKGIKGAFKTEQSERLTAKAAATLEILDARGFKRGSASASESGTQTIPEDASLNDRDQALFDLVDRVTRGFDARMDGAIRQYLGAYVM